MIRGFLYLLAGLAILAVGFVLASMIVMLMFGMAALRSDLFAHAMAAYTASGIMVVTVGSVLLARNRR